MGIPTQLLSRACRAVEKGVGSSLPFKVRGIIINIKLIQAAMDILNDSQEKILPQNCRNALRSKTPDGMDRRIKEYLGTDLRTANIISDVLAEAGVVEVTTVLNPETGRHIKATRLLKEWSWEKITGNKIAINSTQTPCPKQAYGQGHKIMFNVGLDGFSKNEYLNIPEVQDFMNWLDVRLDKPGIFEHRYYLVKVKKEWKCSCLYEAYEKYWWPYRMVCPIQGKQVAGTGNFDSFKYLETIADELRSSIQVNNVNMLQKSILAMLTWGGVLYRNRERIASMGDSICDYFKKVKGHLNLSKVCLGEHDGVFMNSGFTKLYFLLVDNFIMYDGRVGAALGLLGRLYAEENGLARIPSAIEFSFGRGREQSGQTQAKNRRDPSWGKYRLPGFSGNYNRHINDNIKASWLLKAVADKTASRFAHLPQGFPLNERLTAIQSALFMVGYNVNYWKN